MCTSRARKGKATTWQDEGSYGWSGTARSQYSDWTALLQKRVIDFRDPAATANDKSTTGTRD